jgi:uncharacterized membrane protein
MRREHDIAYELEDLRQEVKLLKDKLIIQTPEHFSKRNILSIFSGALFFGLTFMFKGLLVEIALILPTANILLIVASTIMILMGQIYFIGYNKVADKKRRKMGQFVLKRLAASYSIALIVAFYLSFIFGIMFVAGDILGFIKLVLVLTMPCAVGGAIGDLLHKY